MLFNVEDLIKQLEKPKSGPCSYFASESVVNNFQKSCKKIGLSNSSPAIAFIVNNTHQHLIEGKEIQIERSKSPEDRKKKSFYGPQTLWADFSELLIAKGYDVADVVECLMQEFCDQVERLK